MTRRIMYAVVIISICAGVTLVVLRPEVSLQVGNYADDKRAAEDAISQFHARLGAGQYGAIYDDASAAFQQSDRRERILAAMRETCSRYGRPVRITSARLNVLPGAPVQVRAVYDTRFEKGEVTEMFVFMKEGDQVRLVMYDVSPGTARPK